MEKSKQTNNKRWIVYCEPCGYKQIVTEDLDVDLNEIPLADIPGGAPRLNLVTKKIVERKSVSRNKTYKCPKCGRGISSKTLPEVYTKTIKEREKLEEKEREKQEREQRIKDGLLPEKPKFDPNLEIKKRKR